METRNIYSKGKRYINPNIQEQKAKKGEQPNKISLETKSKEKGIKAKAKQRAKATIQRGKEQKRL